MSVTECQDPKKYAPDKTNMSYVPQITQAMSWNFSNGNILDYGCGTGVTGYNLILPQVEATNSTLYSVDICPEIVKVAQQAFPHPRIHYKAGCFPNSIPFENDLKFDKIYSVNDFQFVKDIQTTLKCFKNILKPGGQIGFTATTINCPVMELLVNLLDSPVYGEYLSECRNCLPVWSDYKDASPEEYYRKILMEETGLRQVHFEFIPGEGRFTTKKCLDIFLEMNPNLPKHLSDQIKQEYIQLVTKKLGVSPESSNIPFPVEYICAVLEKPV